MFRDKQARGESPGVGCGCLPHGLYIGTRVV